MNVIITDKKNTSHGKSITTPLSFSPFPPNSSENPIPILKISSAHPDPAKSLSS